MRNSTIRFLSIITILVWMVGCATTKPQEVKWCQGQRCESLGEERQQKEALLVKMDKVHPAKSQ